MAKIQVSIKKLSSFLYIWNCSYKNAREKLILYVIINYRKLTRNIGEYLSEARVKKIPQHKNKQNTYFYVQVIKMENEQLIQIISKGKIYLNIIIHKIMMLTNEICSVY